MQESNAPIRPTGGKYAVPTEQLPWVAKLMLNVPGLSLEKYDPLFQGQVLHTYYLDTPEFDLRKARAEKEIYITLRVRCYHSFLGKDYALDAKTDKGKWKGVLSEEQAQGLIDNTLVVQGLLPGDLQAKLLSITQESLLPVVKIHSKRYAVENEVDRITLDTNVYSDTGKILPCSVLEWKSMGGDPAPLAVKNAGLRPMKMSKYLWSTNYEE